MGSFSLGDQNVEWFVLLSNIAVIPMTAILESVDLLALEGICKRQTVDL